jgi:glycosylphosphatidylinositol transamidase (GPIT) subunit GPI8
LIEEHSVSSEYDKILGIPTADLFTQALCKSIDRLSRFSSLSTLYRLLKRESFGSNMSVRQFMAERKPEEMLLGDFFFE